MVMAAHRRSRQLLRQGLDGSGGVRRSYRTSQHGILRPVGGLRATAPLRQAGESPPRREAREQVGGVMLAAGSPQHEPIDGS
jgi:hypothetical protein